jgi:hypothetical protein
MTTYQRAPFFTADRPTQFHLDVLGPVPTGTAGRAVWCYQAHQLEHHIDHGTRTEAEWQRLLDDLSVTPTLADIADRRVAIQPHHQLCSSDWAPITEQVAAIHAATTEHARPASHHGLEIEIGL